MMRIAVMLCAMIMVGENSWAQSCPFGMMVIQGRCQGVVMNAPEITLNNAMSMPPVKCDDGWTLLTYPGTPLLVCARDLRGPTKGER